MDPTGERRFLQVVWGLVGAEGASGRLVALHERVAFVQTADRSIAVIVHPSLRGAELAERLRELVALDPKTHLELVIVGGDAQMRDVLTSVQPRFMVRRMVHVFHLGADGEAWVGRGGRLESPLGRILVAVGRGQGRPDIERAHLEAFAPPPPSPQDRAEAAEHRAFVLQFRSRRPVLTWALLVTIAIAFGLEMLWGGSELLPTLVRMGANTEQALSSEPWRLLSHAFLHAGPLHLLVNGWVLFALGGFVERVIGWQRTAVLYVLAAVGGGLASAAWTDAGLSVGASGAIWGLLGAGGAMAFRPAGVLPQSLVKPMRRTALINLVINLSISTLPQVDIMAHLGGGVLGAVLVGTGVLMRGLPELEAEGVATPHRERKGWTAVAVALLGVFVASFVIANLTGRPWALRQPPTSAPHRLGDTGLVLHVPTLLGSPEAMPAEDLPALAGTHDDDGVISTFVFGDLLQHPVGAVISVRTRSTPLTDAELEALRPSFVTASTPVPEPGERVGERRVLTDEPRPTFEEDFRFPNGLRMTTRYTLWPTAEVLIETLYWENAPEPWIDAARRLPTTLSEAP